MLKCTYFTFGIHVNESKKNQEYKNLNELLIEGNKHTALIIRFKILKNHICVHSYYTVFHKVSVTVRPGGRPYS